MKTLCWNIVIVTLLPLCSAGEPKQCSTPQQFPQTSLDKKFSSKLKFSSGEKVYYNCAEDFIPSKGTRSVECVDGTWSKLSLKCEKRSCGNAGDLPNGDFHYEGNSYIGEKVYAVCKKGYTLKGMNYMICKRSGWTGDFPACVAPEKFPLVPLGGPTCVAPSVNNSAASRVVSVYKPGEKMTFSCVDGFYLEGALHATCGHDGQWIPPPPKCLPTPTSTQRPSSPTQRPSPSARRPPKPSQSPSRNDSGCGVPSSAGSPHVILMDKYVTKTSFNSGDKVYYVCDVGYTPAGGSRKRLCDNGAWTPLTLRCERKLCGSAGELENGEFIYSGVAFGDTATAVCDVGFDLVGRGVRRCVSDGWDGRNPVCEAVECEEPPEVKNAEKKGLREPPYYYRSVIRYQCNMGVLVGQKEIWCTKNGTWSDPPPQCKEMTCFPPNVPNGYWAASHRATYQFRETISIECKWGFSRIGSRTISCGSTGRWEPRPPRCRRQSPRTTRT